jgi:alkyl sulfatase BDS1-like metallo-beta-lactamase superfamily hydrolase
VANIVFILGDTGYIIIDTLMSSEMANIAYNLIKQYVVDAPILNIIFTHSHIDHFGGVKGLVSELDVNSGKINIIAPAKLFSYAVSEDIIVGNVMSRRSMYMFGNDLPKNEEGQISCGIGLEPSTGTSTIIRPTIEIKEKLQKLIIDGIQFIFQLTMDTEAPTEMNFYLPQFKTLCMAENLSGTMHNILTPRGAMVRDCKKWAEHLTETINIFGDATDIIFTMHSWPIFGNHYVKNCLIKTRDMYKYMHDQTVKLMNNGLTAAEIAEKIKLPTSLSSEWFNQEYYGSLNFNVKSIYQKYLGWFDGNPINLHKLPASITSKKYIEMMGGEMNVVNKSIEYYNNNEYRWTAELLDHVVRINPDNMKAKNLLADCLEQLGYQSGNAVSRNFYLMGAQELRNGIKKKYIPYSTVSNDILYQLTPDMMFDYLSVKLNAERTNGKKISIYFYFADIKKYYLLKIQNCILLNQEIPNLQPSQNDLVVSINKKDFANIIHHVSDSVKYCQKLLINGKLFINGNKNYFYLFLSLFDDFTFWFPLVGN